jgi:hypothetical protein
MKNIRTFENFKTFEEASIGEDFTVGKLIEELKKYDSNLPVRVGCHGYSNQEIVQIVEKGELEDDSEITVLQINGNGSWDNQDEDNEDEDNQDEDNDNGVVHDEEFYPRRGTTPKKVSAFRKFFNLK